MTGTHENPSLEQPKDILANCIIINPQDGAYMRHSVIQALGSPEQPIYVDNAVVDINGVKYDSPMILPVYNGQLKLIQCAVLQHEQRVQILPDGFARGFTYYGELKKDKPVMVCCELGAFFKLAQTPYATVLAVLPDLCKSTNLVLKQVDVNAVYEVIQQLWSAGYKQLYIPVLPQNKKLLIRVC